MASAQRLAGPFNNSHTDSLGYGTVFNIFRQETDTVYKQRDLTVEVVPIDRRTLQLNLSNAHGIIDSVRIKGKYKRGYFKTKREVLTHSLAGRTLWVAANRRTLIGLTKEENLVIISGGSGCAFLTVVPVMISKRIQHTAEFPKTESF